MTKSELGTRDSLFESIIKSEKYKANEKNIGYKIAVVDRISLMF